jgi:hypothetical protein
MTIGQIDHDMRATPKALLEEVEHREARLAIVAEVGVLPLPHLLQVHPLLPQVRHNPPSLSERLLGKIRVPGVDLGIWEMSPLLPLIPLKPLKKHLRLVHPLLQIRLLVKRPALPPLQSLNNNLLQSQLRLNHHQPHRVRLQSHRWDLSDTTPILSHQQRLQQSV